MADPPRGRCPHLRLATLALVGAHPPGWAAATHAARQAEIDALFGRPELADLRRLRFTSPRQAATWLASLHR